MRADDPAAERSSQLHSVFEGSDTLASLVLLLDGEHREIRSMHRHPDSAFGGQLSKALAALFLPGKLVDESEFIGCVTPGYQGVEKGGVLFGAARR
jgi:hypothetical protein